MKKIAISMLLTFTIAVPVVIFFPDLPLITYAAIGFLVATAVALIVGVK